jgi:hypothetical protein
LKDAKAKTFLSAFNALFDGGNKEVDKEDDKDNKSSASNDKEQVDG